MYGEVRSFLDLTSHDHIMRKKKFIKVHATVWFNGKSPILSQNDVGSNLALPLTAGDLGEVEFMYQDAFRNHPQTCWNHQEIYYFTTNPEPRRAPGLVSSVAQVLSVFWLSAGFLAGSHVCFGSFLKLVHMLMLWHSEEVRNLHRCGLSVFLSDWASLPTSGPEGWGSLRERKEGMDVGYTTNSVHYPSLSLRFPRYRIGTVIIYLYDY